MFQDLWNDVRSAVRVLRKSPVFTLATILTLALGIGGNTAIFSLLDGVLLRALPVGDPDRLVTLAVANERDANSPRTSFSYPLLEELRANNTVFSHLFVFRTSQLTLNAETGAERVMGTFVSGDYFDGLGVGAVIGRTLQPNDNLPRAAAPVAVLSYGFWQRRFAADPAVVGQTIRVNGSPFTVVGVARRGFFGARLGTSSDLWIPLWERRGSLAPMAQLLDLRGVTFLPAVARLKPGITREQAEASVTRLWRSLPPPPLGSASAGLAQERILTLPGTGALSNLQRTFAEPLWVLMALVGLVLLIACGNVSALLIVRAIARRGEVAIRAALGASRARIIRPLLVESLLLSGVGMLVGVLGAYWGVGVLLGLLPADRFVLEIQPNRAVLTFSVGLTFVVGVLLGVLPATQLMRHDPRNMLSTESICVTSSGSRFGLRQCLVLAQVAFSVILLVGAGLFVRSLVALQRTDPGVRAEQILQLTLDPASVGYAPREALQVYERIREAVGALPGVRHAAFMLIPMLADTRASNGFYPPGYVPRPGGAESPLFDLVSPGLFETLGIRLSAGREFTERDDATAPRVIIINEAMARRFFRGENPIGKRLTENPRDTGFEIIGVVGETKFSTMREALPAIVFLPFQQWGPLGTSAGVRTLYVRTTGDPLALVEAVRTAIRSIDGNIPLYGVKTVAQQIDETLAQERLTATLSGWFAALALFLAALGLYGLIHYTVQRRWRELGLRIALGAAPRRIARLVLGEALMLVGAGIAVGLAVAIPLARLVLGLLFSVTPTDLDLLLTAAGLMGAIGISAAALPAWRAARVDPMQALRP